MSEKLLERVEVEMLKCAQIAVDNPPGQTRTLHRAAAMEWAAIATALRASKEQSNGYRAKGSR